MVGVKSPRVKPDKQSEMLRVIKTNPNVTTAQLARMFHVHPNTILTWKRNNDIAVVRPESYKM